MSKWPDSKDPSATFFTKGSYSRYHSEAEGSHNSPARPNPEVSLFDAVLEHNEKRKKSEEEKQLDEVLINL